MPLKDLVFPSLFPGCSEGSCFPPTCPFTQGSASALLASWWSWTETSELMSQRKPFQLRAVFSELFRYSNDNRTDTPHIEMASSSVRS